MDADGRGRLPRVAVVANRLSSAAPTGVERYSRELLTSLARRTDLDCLAVTPPEPAKDAGALGVQVHRIHVPRKLLHLGWSVLGVPRVDRFTGPVDLVHVTSASFPVPSKAPVVYTIHDLLPLTRPEWFPRSHRWAFARALDDACHRAAAIITDAPTTAADLVRRHGVDPTRIATIPLGLPAWCARPVDAADAARTARDVGVEPGSFVLFVGEPNARKNVRVVVEALARMTSPVELVVAGPRGAGTAAVAADAAARGIADRVHVTGYVPDDVLGRLMAAARALVHPSQEEGFGLTPLEAMALGTPPIVARPSAATLPAAVHPGIVVADPDDADEWAHAIATLGDADRRRALVSDGRDRAKEFTWQRTADATSEAYRAVLEGRPVSPAG